MRHTQELELAALGPARPLPRADLLAAAAPPPVSTTLCVRQGLTGPYSRRSFSLRRSSAHALFYVDDVDAGDFVDPADWDGLALAWEQSIYPTVTSVFGPPSDVDGNGKLTIAFTSQVGPASAGGIVVGYFAPVNVVYPLDNSSTCSGTASNGADLFMMNTPTNLATAGYTRAKAMQVKLPQTLAHEFQHLINTNVHCLLLAGECTRLEEAWLNEALSKVAEDAVGLGWHSSRDSAQQYLLRAPAGGLMGYSQASIVVWQGDPVGNYEGVHSFLRYLVDQRGDGILAKLVGDSVAGNALVGRENFRAGTGITFEAAFADFATAAAFSNEANVPDSRFNYAGTDWTPFHQKVGPLDSVPLVSGAPSTASLRQDGWNAFRTGAAGAGGAVVRVSSSEAVKPGVVFVKVPAPCSTDVIVYWDACNSAGCQPPQAGFVVPGLTAANGFSFPQLDCVMAGVDSVQVFVSGTLVPCSGAGNCFDASTWRCGIGGLSVPVLGSGTYTVQVKGFDPTGAQKFQSQVDPVNVAACGTTTFGSYSSGLPGPMGLGYTLAALAAPTGPNCATAAGSDGTFMWFTVTAPDGTTVDEVGRNSAASAFSVPCGSLNPIPLFPAGNGQPATMPAGVYRLSRIEEVVRFPNLTTQTFRAHCSAWSLVHAGPELLASQAVTVNVPLATTATCWP